MGIAVLRAPLEVAPVLLLEEVISSARLTLRDAAGFGFGFGTPMGLPIPSARLLPFGPIIPELSEMYFDGFL